MESKNYLLTNHEFVLIAVAAGITAVRGFDMGIDEMNREETVLALQELTSRGLLENTGEGFSPVGGIADIFSIIRDADTTLEVHKKSGKTCLLYLAGDAVKVMMSARREGTWEVSRLAAGEIWNHLVEEGWIPTQAPELPEELSWMEPGFGAELYESDEAQTEEKPDI
ncbi:MAG: hypothetical protein LIO96_09385 [Lachnospiraceae bacterium]|nr:hypothetical protein [Lachnospiraceae bacterium]